MHTTSVIHLKRFLLNQDHSEEKPSRIIVEKTKVTLRNQSKALQASIVAMTAALYAIFFFLSWTVSLPQFTVLYLPIILLGVFPLWFGWSGLIGSMIGAYIGGVYIENLPLHLAWVEITTALIIYCLNWLLITRKAAEAKTAKSIAIISSVYAISLFLGTIAILWQFTLVGLFPAEVALACLLPTYALNLPIALTACPALIRAVSPKLKILGVYTGNFKEWRSNQVRTNN
jgi:hypothetical protein